MKKHAIIPIFISHRGCPHKCVFCDQKAITARTGDVSVADAEKTIEEWLTTLDGRDIETEISFFGGSFTGIPINEQISFLKLAKRYKDAGKVSKIHCSTRPDFINRDILDVLKDYGMDVIELGVQSFDPDVLTASRRGHSVEDVYKACELIKEYGFTLGIQLMIGLPKDNFDACMLSVDKTVEIGPQIARLYPTVVLENTELFSMSEQGLYKPWTEEDMLRTVKAMYRKLTENDIDVIRIGLKSNEFIKGDTYHPAFGQLVKSSVALDDIVEQIKLLGFPKSVEIRASSKTLNFASGHKASNRIYLKQTFPDMRIRFVRDEDEKAIRVIKSE